MSRFAEEFRSEARERAGKVAVRRVRGWSFCLSYGAVDPRDAADMVESARMVLEEHGRDVTRETVDGFRAMTDKDVRAVKEALGGEWLLSAKLFPPGRSSSEDDWRFLGEMLGALRVPPEVAMSIGAHHPSETHYWRWTE